MTNQPMKVVKKHCNFTYHHEAHSMIVVSAPPEREPILWICGGSQPRPTIRNY